MAREVIGYLADDATFFEDQRDAELHDATNELLRGLQELKVHGRFIDYLHKLHGSVRRYLDAHDAITIRDETMQVDDPNLPKHDPDPKAVEDSLDSLQHEPISSR